MESYLHFLLLPLFLFLLLLAGATPPEPRAEEAAAVGLTSAGKLPLLPGHPSSLSASLKPRSIA